MPPLAQHTNRKENPSDILHQVRQGDLETASQSFQNSQARFLVSVFDLRDKDTSHPGTIGKVFLRQRVLSTQLANPLPKTLPDVFLHALSMARILWATTLPIGYTCCQLWHMNNCELWK